ncbi:cysteine desulfurase [Thermus arciformis]|uniref:cysteine desulfurase n=1 Tax=Thermus arciformis TaxID=482827 RepID=A0A1G7FZM2_9DEIN|nr:cysteine desulfurase [Thermus arciformis]SDE81341.1 cysteine desulfurase [Thermus arciformis]
MDLSTLRVDFPLIAGRPDLVYLDSAATSQKPRRVIESLKRFYETLNANVHRGAYRLSAEATEAYEEARKRLARFLNANPQEIVFVRNTTEAMNLVAYAWGLRHLREGDEVLVTEMEHHAGLVPWHLVAGLKGAKVKAIPLTEEGRLDLSALDRLLTERTRVVSLVHMSNVLGTINPVAEIARKAKEAGALVVVDGAQSAPHLPVDVKALGADFFALSGHKMLGPTGAGVLWGRYPVLEEMGPFLGGGEMIREVHVDRSTYAPPPQRFEAGTPPIAEAIALGEAACYLMEVGMEKVFAHDRALLAYALKRLEEVPRLRVYGPRGEDRGGVIPFTLGRLHAHDLATFLDQEGIAVRAGHHCAQPLHRKLGLAATARASFYLYNTKEEVDRFVEALLRIEAKYRAWL